jgi:tetratricopeptide (TPR) repeat protein
VRLIEAANETLLWSEAYERELSDCVGAPHGKLSIQTDVAAHVARALALELVPPVPAVVRPLDAAAYQAYLKGRYHWSRTDGDDGLERAIDCYEQAVRQEPSFAPAYAALARAQVCRAEIYRECPRQALEAAQALAVRALSLDPSLCEAHLARADAIRMLGWDWTGAEHAYAQARALNPSFVGAYRCYAVMLAAMARYDDAMRESDRAFELDPLCLEAGTAAAWVRYLSGDAVASIDYCRNALDMDPEWVPARRVLGAACLEAGRGQEAIAELERAVSLAEGDPVPLLWLAHAEAAAGSRAEAVRLVERARKLGRTRYVPWSHMALAYVGLGDAAAALDALDHAVADCDPHVGNLAVEPRFRALHDEQRFHALVAKIGLRV